MILTIVNYLVCYLFIGFIFGVFMHDMWQRNILNNVIPWTRKDDIIYLLFWPMILLSILIFGMYKLFTISKSLFKKINKK